jgi:hypothetical protein
VHSFRRLTKKNNRYALRRGLLQYDNNEEFYAVLVTNVFISDPSNDYKSSLRQGHHAPSQPLDKSLASSLKFFRSSRQAYQLIARFFQDHPTFARQLAKSKAVFNPFAAYDRNPALARQMSESGEAQARDAIGTVIETIESREFESRFISPLLQLIGQ